MSSFFSRYYKDLFLGSRLFILLGVAVVLFLLEFFFPWLGIVPTLFFFSVVVLFAADLVLLYKKDDAMFALRVVPERLSNGDENNIRIYLENFYPFKVTLGIIDEIPFQFQKRDLWFRTELLPGEKKNIEYSLRPLKRGEYQFNDVHVYTRSPLQLASRRFTFSQSVTLPVYPSFLQMHKYELMAASNRLAEIGVKRIRRVGHSMEFDQVKNYIAGDDYRTINWKATARRGALMVNSFSDEKAQNVYCVIDKSRSMKMPFEGLSLLDYAINAALVLSDIALLKEDKAGLITVSEKIGTVIPAERKPVQIKKILDVLYKEKTRYLEVNMEALYNSVRSTLKQRSLVVFFTNFESMHSLQRQLPFLRRIARLHLLLVVFFENTELKSLSDTPAKDIEGIYIRTVAEKFAWEKKLIVKELARYGIQSVLTPPQKLTVNTLNRYLEIKARQEL